MSFFSKLFKSEACPFYGKTLTSNKQIRVNLDGSQEMIPSVDSINLSISEKSIKYKDNVTGENFEFFWKLEKKEGDRWYFIDNRFNQWILSPNLISWTLISEQQNVSFVLNATNSIVKNVMDARLKELSLTKGHTETEPLYSIWKCPTCKKEVMDLVGIQLSRDITIKGMAEKLSKSPLTILSNVPYCNCNALKKERMQLTYSLFCVFNTKDKFDLQIHNSYNSQFGEKGIELYMVGLDGQAQKFTKEQRTKFIGF